MNRKQRLKRNNNQCKGKRRYAKGEAIFAARILRDKGEKVGYYPCAYCHYYHVGHIKQ